MADAGADLPAHGAPSGGRAAWRSSSRSITSTSRPTPSTRSTRPSSRSSSRRRPRTLPQPIVYAVPGSPLVAERTVELLRSTTAGGSHRRAGALLPRPGLGAPRHRPAQRGGAAGRCRAVRRAGRRRRGDRSWWPSAGRSRCSPTSSCRRSYDGGRSAARGGAPAPPRPRGRAGGPGRLVGPRPHARARPPDLPLHPELPAPDGAGARDGAAGRAWCARCAPAARGIASRPTAR